MPTDSDAATKLLTPTVTELDEVTVPEAGETVSQLPPLAVLALAAKESPLDVLVTETVPDAGVRTPLAKLNASAPGVTETTGIAGPRTMKYTRACADRVFAAVADTLVTVIVPE